MAIPKKGSRVIVVEGESYRWAVRRRPTYSQAIAQSPLSFAVELGTSGQTTLVVTVNASRPDNWVGSPSKVITPAVVESAIRKALQQGWQPSEKGSPYALQLS
jgi:hypothetical protein